MNMNAPLRRSVTLLALLAAVIALATGSHSVGVSHAATAAADQDTQDIIHMRDGRVLTGKILSEDATQIVFRYIDQTLNLQTTITLERRDVVEIERDVAVEGADGEDAEEQTEDLELEEESGPVQRSRPRDLPVGLAEGEADDESLPSFYVIPMKGQMGTDIRLDAYEPIIEDIRSSQPDVVVWVMECADIDELMISMSDENEQGLVILDDYRDLVRALHDELRGIRQVMWVHDSVGISSLMALAWEEMYMTPGARLTGFRAIYEMASRQGDEDVAAKMVAAWIGIINGFLQRGDRPIALGEAMTRPDRTLSASWRGREVIWHLNTSGEYVVNASTKATANFRAKTAEDFGISSGTAESLDDLALLLGFREYRVIEGGADHIVERYVENWRRSFENAKQWWADFDKHMGWAGGDQALRWLGRARNDLARILAAMNRYPAIEIRFMRDIGVSKFQLQTIEEQIREQIRALRAGGRGGAGGGGGGLGGRTR